VRRYLLTYSHTRLLTYTHTRLLTNTLTHQPTQPHSSSHLQSHQFCYSFNDSLHDPVSRYPVTHSLKCCQTTAHLPTLPPINSLHSLTLSVGNPGDMGSMFFICDGIIEICHCITILSNWRNAVTDIYMLRDITCFFSQNARVSSISEKFRITSTVASAYNGTSPYTCPERHVCINVYVFVCVSICFSAKRVDKRKQRRKSKHKRKRGC